MVVAHCLGVPEQDRTYFYGWADAIVDANLAKGGIAKGGKIVVCAFTTMMGYFTELIKLRRHVPGDDAISQLVVGGIGDAGDIAGTLSVLASALTAVASGIDTITGMLGAAVQLLHQRPDQCQLLAKNPEHIPDSLDEFLRLTAPVKGRIATRDVTIGDITIAKGRLALLLYGSANRDERKYGPDAGRLDAWRRPRDILTFQPRCAQLPGRAGSPDAVAGRIDRAAGPLPGFRG